MQREVKIKLFVIINRSVNNWRFGRARQQARSFSLQTPAIFPHTLSTPFPIFRLSVLTVRGVRYGFRLACWCCHIYELLMRAEPCWRSPIVPHEQSQHQLNKDGLSKKGPAYMEPTALQQQQEPDTLGECALFTMILCVCACVLRMRVRKCMYALSVCIY